MAYEFLDKARSQPDLQDVVQYLKKPLTVIEDINKKYISMTVEDKTQLTNMEIYRSCDKILHKYLPNLIDNYCAFSLQYRNLTVIKEEQSQTGFTHYTAKELLLRDLAHIVEETHILEQQFNDTNRQTFVSNSRVIKDNLGYQPNIKLPGDTQPERVKLANEFNYTHFIESDNFFEKKHIYLTPDESDNKNNQPLTQSVENEKLPNAVNNKKIKKHFFSLDFFIGCICLLPLIWFVSTLVVHNHQDIVKNDIRQSLYSLEVNIKDLWATSATYSHLNNTVLLNAQAVPSFMIEDGNITLIHHPVDITPYSKLGDANMEQHFKVSISHLSSDDCQTYFQALPQDRIDTTDSYNKNVFIDGQPINTLSEVSSFCQANKEHTIDYIEN